jgi:hypothetical protein
MTATLQLSPEREAALKTQAQARGLTLEQWLIELTDRDAPSLSIAICNGVIQRSGPAAFDAFIDRQNPNRPVLCDKAMSHESIYSDHS